MSLSLSDVINVLHKLDLLQMISFNHLSQCVCKLGSFVLPLTSARVNMSNFSQAHDGLKDARDLKDLLGWVGVSMNLNPAQLISKAGQYLDF